MEKPGEGASDIKPRAGGGDVTQPPSTNAAIDPGPLASKGPDKPQQLANASSSESTRRDGYNEWWLVILATGRRGVREYDVRVKEDTGTPVNWIHPDVVRNCNLNSLEEACTPTFFVDMNGKNFKCEKSIRITWCGRKRNSYEERFFISPPKAPIHMILGDEFVTKNGRVKEICADRRKAEDARLFVATSLTEEQKRQMKDNEIEHNKQSAEVIARSQQGKHKSSPKKGDSTERQEKGKRPHKNK